jgi:hypothetical protein
MRITPAARIIALSILVHAGLAMTGTSTNRNDIGIIISGTAGIWLVIELLRSYERID